jgi:hypothetical protein
MSEYLRRAALLEEERCPGCYGLGKCNDAEPGDIYYNEWVCPACNGSGVTPKAAA